SSLPQERAGVQAAAAVLLQRFQHLVLGGGEHALQAAQHREREDHLAVVGLLVVATQQVRDGPGEVGELSVLAAVHRRHFQTTSAREGGSVNELHNTAPSGRTQGTASLRRGRDTCDQLNTRLPFDGSGEAMVLIVNGSVLPGSAPPRRRPSFDSKRPRNSPRRVAVSKLVSSRAWR